MSELPADVPGDGVGDGVGRCPSCGARTVPEQDWCSLCLQPLRVAPEPAGAPDPASTSPGPDGQPGARPDPGSVDPYAGLRPPGAPAADGALPPGVAEAMLAELAASSAADRPLSRGPLAGTSRAVRVALACGAALVLALVLVGLLALVGLLL